MSPSISLILDDVVRVHVQGQMLLLNLRDIVAIRSRENYSLIHFADERITKVRIPLKAWIEGLPDTAFLRVHRTTLVNRRRLLGVRYLGPKKWALGVDGLARPVPVGRLYWRQVREDLACVSGPVEERLVRQPA